MDMQQQPPEPSAPAPGATPRATPGAKIPVSYQLNVAFSPEQRTWLQGIADQMETSLAGACRWVVDRARTDKAEGELKTRRASRKARFLQGIQDKYFPELAAVEAEVTMGELDEWFQDAAFVEQVEYQQGIYRANVQDRLLKVGEGSNKGGNALALIEILKAIAPEYGRAKMELVQRTMNNMIKEIFRVLSDEFGPSQQETLSRALQKVGDKMSLKLTDYAR